MSQIWSADSAIDLVERLLSEAAKSHASDLHLDPQKKSVHVRFRVDGSLRSVGEIDLSLHEGMIARIKILAGLRSDLHYAAQDGRFSCELGLNNYDIRVAVAPTFYGENAVLRLLPESGKNWSLEDLGFSLDNQKKMQAALSKSGGMVLASGPTGSGKTTTLYTLLRQLNSPDLAVVTLEDPVEYAITGVRHIAINPGAGLTFAHGLRWLVRQNPDVLLIGEIRDDETAHAAVHSALTGHKLLSSLHTQDSASTLVRLLDFGIEPFLITSTVSVIVAQRLVRKLCDHCKKPASVKETDATKPKGENALAATHAWEPVGCWVCHNTGFNGRIGVQEVLVMNSELRLAVEKKLKAQDIAQIAKESGMQTMYEDGLAKVNAGLTSVSEIIRVL